jgi:phosphate acetyltransferase
MINKQDSGSDAGVLLKRPQNRTTKRIFIAATRQNDGKTTTSLALFSALRERTDKVGFIKPIGQRFIEVDGIKVDEDTVLLDAIFNVQVPMEAMSPIAIDPTFTRRYLENPDGLEVLVDRLCRAFDRAAYEKDYIIVEGTGHAGVGSVFDLSNAHVAKLLDAKVIIVAGGGIGRPIDEIAINKALFDRMGVPIIGALINKVEPSKMDTIRKYCDLALRRMGIPLLGCIPRYMELTEPNLAQVVEEVGGRWLNGRANGSTERIKRFVMGAMTAKGFIEYFEEGVLIITPGDREDILFAALAAAAVAGEKKALSGILLTRNVLPHPKVMDMIAKTNIPVIICSEDSYAVASRINNMTIKTQPTDTDKIPIIKSMITENLDIDTIIDTFSQAETLPFGQI